MVIRTLAMAVSSLVLAGCVSVGPNYKAPVQEPVVLKSAQQPVFSSVSPVASWWAQFDDPVLEELVHGALSDNLDLRVAVARVSQARAVFVESRFDQAPHITAGGSYDRRKQPDPQLGGQRVFSESYQLGFDAGWELDLFGRKRRAAEAARADRTPNRPTWPTRRCWLPLKWRATTSNCVAPRSASQWPSTRWRTCAIRRS